MSQECSVQFEVIHKLVLLAHLSAPFEVQLCSVKPAWLAFPLPALNSSRLGNWERLGLETVLLALCPAKADQNRQQKDCLCGVKFLRGKYHSRRPRKP